jgi:hypothetical protein
MIGRCATCKFWTRNLPPDEWEIIENDDGTPMYPFAGDGYGVCDLSRTINGRPIHPHALMNALDAEQYAAKLGTHQTFGCVMHERKEE